MTTLDPETFLMCDDAPDPASATLNGGQPAAPTGPGDAPETPFDPSRWVMTGWRHAKGAPLVTWQQLAAVLGATQGPCARCGAAHHRYGVGGQPLCPACRTAP